MFINSYKITGESASMVTGGFVRGYQQKAYERNYPGGFIRYYEDHSFLNGSNILISIRMEYPAGKGDEVSIEIIAGGGGVGGSMKGDLWGGQKRRVVDFSEALRIFCELHQLTMTEILPAWKPGKK
jgi:hypothetical protein